MKNKIENEIRYRVAKIFLLTLKEEGVIDNEKFLSYNRKLIQYYKPFIDILMEEDICKKEK